MQHLPGGLHLHRDREEIGVDTTALLRKAEHTFVSHDRPVSGRGVLNEQLQSQDNNHNAMQSWQGNSQVYIKMSTRWRDS